MRDGMDYNSELEYVKDLDKRPAEPVEEVETCPECGREMVKDGRMGGFYRCLECERNDIAPTSDSDDDPSIVAIAEHARLRIYSLWFRDAIVRGLEAYARAGIRALFEAHALQNDWLSVPEVGFAKLENGEYQIESLQNRWEGWLAARTVG